MVPCYRESIVKEKSMKKQVLCFLTAALMVACGLGGCEYEGTNVSTKSCKKDCTSEGGRLQDCFLISDKEVCKDVCLGKNEGVNAPACWRNASLGPDATYLSITDTCAKDELGNLYSVSYESENCPNGCESGNCQPALNSPCKKDCNMDGGRQMTCVRIGSEESCKPACFGENEGVNAPECWRNASLGPNAADLSITDTCAKDELGTLYVVSSASETCTNGCESGECKHSSDVTTCTKNCDEATTRNAAGICVHISGEEVCKPACLGNKSGENKLCFEDPDTHEVFPVTDNCAEDELGTLYSESSVRGMKCNNGCEDGECKPVSGTTCTKNCQTEGGRFKICVRLSGQEECKNRCEGNVAGVNQSVCYRVSSLPPGQSEFALTDTCEADELGTLYSVSDHMEPCRNGCESGKCKPAGECSLPCSPDQYNRPTICVKIADVEACKPECAGTNVGDNSPICYKPYPSEPSSPEYVLTDTCALSDGGMLYSSSVAVSPCLGGCKNSACIICNKNCMTSGGLPGSCYVISGASVCKTYCMSPNPKVGVNDPYCYTNLSMGPDTKPVSLTATCAEDDNGRFYMESKTTVPCTSTCTDGVCD